MKGFVLNTGNETLSGGLGNGITGVHISNKEGIYRLIFGGMDGDGVFYTWYRVDRERGDSFTRCYDEIVDVSPAKTAPDNRNTAEDDKRALESYHKLKQELIDEGLISGHE